MLPTLVRMSRSRTYSEAIALLNTCQSNAATIEAIRKSGGRLNDFAVLEMHDYLRRIGYKPDDLNKLNVVHITGTKGKGSTSAFTERILRSHLSGKVGLYTSPHLCAVRERIRVNGEPLSEEVFAKLFFEVWEKLENDQKTPFPHTPVFPIYFRLLTLLAFHAFLSLGVEATVLEVGIGGLYDSTNIVPKPIVTGISALGLDHTAVLGNTIEEIAKNKAGIYKPSVPALSVPQDRGGEVLESTAKQVGAPYEVVKIIPEDTKLGVPGTHQRINASLAVALSRKYLEAKGYPINESGPSSSSSSRSNSTLPQSFRKPLAETRWPGRCQVVQDGETRWLLDGAHTTESLTSCGQWAWEEGNPDVLIFNCSGGRAAETLLGSLLDAGAKASGKSLEDLGRGFEEVVFCTNVTYADGNFKGGELCPISSMVTSGRTKLMVDLTSKAIDPDDLSALATQNALREAWLRLNPTFDPAKVHAKGSIQEAVEIARKLGKRDVLVAGSLHLVGGVMSVAELNEALSMA